MNKPIAVIIGKPTLKQRIKWYLSSTTARLCLCWVLDKMGV